MYVKTNSRITPKELILQEGKFRMDMGYKKVEYQSEKLAGIASVKVSDIEDIDDAIKRIWNVLNPIKYPNSKKV